MAAVSRREFLQRLAAAYAGAVLSGCNRKGDRFANERVCIHVLHPGEFVPAPLLERTAHIAGRKADEEYFNIGLPELLVCESKTRLLDAFQYFWPFSRRDFETLQESITIQYQRSTVETAQEVAEFASFLRDNKSRFARTAANLAVIFTFNDATRQWSPEIVAACRESSVQELVVLKDPTLPPYLCDYPAKQKGFKRPPP